MLLLSKDLPQDLMDPLGLRGRQVTPWRGLGIQRTEACFPTLEDALDHAKRRFRLLCRPIGNLADEAKQNCLIETGRGIHSVGV